MVDLERIKTLAVLLDMKTKLLLLKADHYTFHALLKEDEREMILELLEELDKAISEVK